jgi:hypothetical protein
VSVKAASVCCELEADGTLGRRIRVVGVDEEAATTKGSRRFQCGGGHRWNEQTLPPGAAIANLILLYAKKFEDLRGFTAPELWAWKTTAFLTSFAEEAFNLGFGSAQKKEESHG